MTPEALAREVIDRKLHDAGWVVQDTKAINLGAATGVAVREYPTDTGPADYLLFVDRQPETYARWLVRKPAAHLKRDRKRDRECTGAAYREAIHSAVVRSGGRDEYTGEMLDWHLVSTYANEASKAGRHMNIQDFISLCEKVLRHSGHRVEKA